MHPSENTARIRHFIKEQFYNSLITFCRGKGQPNISRLYSATALILYERVSQGVNELNGLRSENGLQLPVTVCLNYANRMYKMAPETENIEVQLKELRKGASADELYQTAVVLFMFEKYKKALDYVNKALNLEAANDDCLCLKGWLTLRGNNKASHLFEHVLQNNAQCLNAALGLAESYLFDGNTEGALNVLNKTIVKFPTNNLPLIQKMAVLFALQDWEQTIETMNRVVLTDPNNLEAIQTNILILICRDGNYDEAAACIKKFCDALENVEPKNAKVYLKNAILFSKNCGRNANVLTETYKMAEMAVQTSPKNADYLNELGYQCLLQEKVREASKLFKSATKISDASVSALIGLTLCELMQNGRSEQTRHQAEFLAELEEDPSPMLLMIQAKLAESADDALARLEQAVEKHLSAVKQLPYGVDYLLKLNADFLLDIVKEYLEHIPATNSAIDDARLNQNDAKLLATPLNLLKTLTNACPGLQEAIYLLARLQCLNGETQAAILNLERIITNPMANFYEAHLLMAQLQLKVGVLDRAAQNLEMSLSQNFSVRDNPLYHFLSGLLMKRGGSYNEAIGCFNAALTLTSKSKVSLQDKAAIYKELITSHLQANQTENLNKLIQEAMDEMQGTVEESKIMMLNADIAIYKKNIKGAIDILMAVAPNDACYLEAKKKLAAIFLDDSVDKKAYIKCYEDLVQTNPTSESYVLLADAYMEILDDQRAIAAYKQALALNPKNLELHSKLGHALFRVHNFTESVDFYKTAIQKTQDADLKLQLAEVYVAIKRYTDAEQLLVSEVESERTKNSDDLTSLQYKTRLLLLLAVVQEKAGNLSLAVSTLKEAKSAQGKIKKRLSLEGQGVTSLEETMKLVEINAKLAQLCVCLKDNEQAVNHYKDGLAVAPDDVDTLEQLAKLYMQMNYLELCQQVCIRLLDLDADNETAAILMADIAFRKVDFDMAVFHLTQLVTKKLTNWTTFEKFIEIMRRTGNLADVEKFLEQAEKQCGSNKTGFFYCKGLYEWYSGNLNAALKYFNNARQDVQWRQKAIFNMIEICLNPNDEMLGDQFSDFGDREYKDSRSLALKTADRLLKELKQFNPKGADELRYHLLANFILLATKDKYNVERALEEFINLASQDQYKDSVGPLLGIAAAHTMLKQSQRAKNQLKRVAKNIWTFHDAEYLERCWLLLADYYVQSAKYDLAYELLKRIIQYNRMSVRAYELSGTIAEKEQRYKEAANFYESAWKFSGYANLPLGFKAAYNFMKSKRFVNAIDVCQQVLKVNPDYPRIKKDILDKSINNLRT